MFKMYSKYEKLIKVSIVRCVILAYCVKYK